MAKTKEQIERAAKRKKIRSALIKINRLMNRADDLFKSLPPDIQDEIFNIHVSHCSMNHCLRWGVEASIDLLRKEYFKKITQNL